MASDDLGLVQSPAQTAEAVCHDQQMTVWVDEIAGDLSMGGYLRDDLTYDEALTAGATISHALRRIIGAAFTHPELDALSAEGSATIAAADPPIPQRRQADMATDYNDWKSLLDGRFWLEMREPGKVPQRKGSWPRSMLKETLREFMKANPAAMISVVTISHDGPWFDDAPEALAVLDGRTWPM